MQKKILELNKIKDTLLADGYHIAEENAEKPWGGYFRLDNSDAEKFIAQYFPGTTLSQARLGHDDIELSPKILVVSPLQRLSWQYHHRRAEKWHFLTEGRYIRSATDTQTEEVIANQGTIVQFQEGERHRLIAGNMYTVVAEIWQHTRPGELSNEDDIVRLEDDYSR